MGTTARKVITSDKVELTIGTIADGQVAVRSGNLITGTTIASGSVVHNGFSVIDFGPDPAYEAFAVIPATWIDDTVNVIPWFDAVFGTADNSFEDHEQAAETISIMYWDFLPGVSFTIKANCRESLATGQFNFEWLAVPNGVFL
jgi:hypothetical protein